MDIGGLFCRDYKYCDTKYNCYVVEFLNQLVIVIDKIKLHSYLKTCYDFT